jgi:hypothetical protein
MEKQKEYGDLMQHLLYSRGRYASDEDFNRFVVDCLRDFVYDLRDFEVYISISPDSLKWSRQSVNGLSKRVVC